MTTTTKSKAQELYLELIRLTSHNALNGEVVAADLIEHSDWWDAAFLVHEPSNYLIVRRDMPKYHNADTLYIRVKREFRSQMRALADSKNWKATEVHWMPEVVHDPTEALLIAGCGSIYNLLRVRWD